ncbi:hypothetical protein Tco_0112351, partial [Tanacetum coccineum]
HDIQLSLVVDYFQWLVSAVLTQMTHLVTNITFASTSSTSFLPSVLLLTIVGVAVVVVATGAVVESSSIVKLSFVHSILALEYA